MEVLYLQLCALASTAPDFQNADLASKDVKMWLGRAAVAIAELARHPRDMVVAAADVAEFQSLCGQLDDYYWGLDRQDQLMTIFYRALARAESLAPAAMQGAFIPAGHAFDAITAFSKVVGTAKRDVMIMDPYADEKVLMKFGVLTPETASLRVFADGDSYKPSLKPAAESWRIQFPKRALVVRISPPRALHDRLIFVDGETVWQMGQSLNHFAERAHTSIVRVDPETAKLKINAYESIWAVSSNL